MARRRQASGAGASRRYRVAGRNRDARRLSPKPFSRHSPGALPHALWTGLKKNPAAAASLATAIAAIVSALVATAALQATQRQIGLAEQGQLTDRYIRAVGQLSGTDPTVTLASIYALERLAIDSPRDQPAIVEVLSAFLRSRSPAAGPPCAVSPPSTVPSSALADQASYFKTLPPTPPADFSAALSVLERRDRTRDGNADYNLSRICLRYTLVDTHLDDARLNLSNLSGAVLAASTFRRANLRVTNLVNAQCTTSDFSDASLSLSNASGADFTLTVLERADLEGAILTGANLSHANLVNANLTNANLAGADLTGAVLTGANLTGANITEAKIRGAFEPNLTGSVGRPR